MKTTPAVEPSALRELRPDAQSGWPTSREEDWAVANITLLASLNRLHLSHDAATRAAAPHRPPRARLVAPPHCLPRAVSRPATASGSRSASPASRRS